MNEEDKLEDGEVQSPEAEEEQPAIQPSRHSTEASVDVEPSEDDKAIVGESIAAPTKVHQYIVNRSIVLKLLKTTQDMSNDTCTYMYFWQYDLITCSCQ